ncbi:MAG TPA: hypothetical protein VK175_06245 [Leadbetterella sp.]|nr:hypothetical protein [Leadbetterella sp.]
MSDDGPAFGSAQAAGVLVVVKDKDAETASMPSVAVELLDDNLAAFLLAGGVDVKGLMALLNEYLDFTRAKENSFEPMEVLESWYRRDGIEDFIERLRHDSRRVGKAADAATVRESPKALGKGQDK